MDLISRQAAIDAINNTGLPEDEKDTAQRVLEQIPPIEPEIIRCRYCKHYSELQLPSLGIKCGKCNWGDPYFTDERVWEENDFCSHGKRRTDAEG